MKIKTSLWMQPRRRNQLPRLKTSLCRMQRHMNLQPGVASHIKLTEGSIFLSRCFV